MSNLEPEVIFADDHILVIDKPAGLLSHASADKGRPHAEAWVRSWLKREGRPARLHLAHRLDAATSGLLLFVLNPALNGAVTELFASHEVERRYYAICARTDPSLSLPPRVEGHIAQVSKRPARWGSVKSGGQPAATTFELISEAEYTLHVEASPITGRTHQIRIHLAEAGLPIIGDKLYAGRLPRAVPTSRRLLLHAQALSFIHPLSGARVELRARLPADFNDLRFQR